MCKIVGKIDLDKFEVVKVPHLPFGVSLKSMRLPEPFDLSADEHFVSTSYEYVLIEDGETIYYKNFVVTLNWLVNCAEAVNKSWLRMKEIHPNAEVISINGYSLEQWLEEMF